MTVNNVPVKSIPEVDEFTKAQRALDEFKANNEEFFAMLQPLVDRYNASLELADKKVRAQQVSCGPFQLTGRPSVSYDAEKIIEEMGRDFFIEIGGVIAQRTVYEIEKSKAEAAFAAGYIPDEVVKVVRKTKVAYHKPDKVVLP
jgi:hypothetical protein